MKTMKKLLLPTAIITGLLAADSAVALDVSVSGFIRQEMAYKISNDENPANRHGSPLNGKTVNNAALDHPGARVLLDLLAGGDGSGTTTNFLESIGIWGDLSKADVGHENDWNVFATKAELDFTVGISDNFSAFAKLRGYYQPDVFEEFGENNGFEVENHGNEATFLSMSDDDYMVDIPALYLDYTNGPVWIRVGQQQIAWGEALFFRVADVANGLDLRRHLIYDLGAEEYADERLSAPGVRATFTLSTDWSLEVFAQMFQPTVLPPRGSPYNLIPYAFTPNYKDGFDEVDDTWNAGFRLTGQLGNLGVQAFAVSRHNPDPIFTWAPGGFFLGNPGLDSIDLDPIGMGALESGQTFADQPFVPDLTGMFGTNSAADWFAMAGLAGLNGVEGLNQLALDYGYTNDAFLLFSAFGLTDGFGVPQVSTIDQASALLDVFFTGLGPLEATIDATYAYENVFGFGLNYIFYSEPDTFLDQLVVRFEASYTPDKKFTNPNLSKNFLTEDEWVTGLVFEKYHRFSDAFPATFFVFEWMHKSESDLLGRHLSGLGGNRYRAASGGEEDGGWDGLVFAFQQPFPNLVWRADLSVLYDLNGGILVQPAVRYKPSAEWTMEAFVNIIDAKDNASIFAPTEWADDVSMRLTYQF